ncbi:DeoR/GlpR family DNA-binding transcription regulator [Caldifermentibacillus hisashii]|uniref:DeoR/GlpR family DNA-binding transcription regulator n=1 Tax=Bacillaceae TaxID=186817 RepID=UPI0020402942|nr:MULTISPECIES: DeoR/GlpR family DNA-binding transcription regulator [Bacillaceae]MCM3054884.1 DeoR/GlpR family DNA-binding transcription regulator [Caldibacillus thermoamylovorans]MED4850709.1 DeoR/GlpR family DNA-binding transcription regulator [Caldifermentibacillus hisashii]
MNKLFADERRELILSILREKKRVTVKELAKDVNVSEATLRTDLNILEEEGLLTRTHGGAILNVDLPAKKSFSEREKKNRESKMIIAKKAIKHISHKDCILLDASTTGLELARLLRDSNMKLTVVTNGISTAIELKENPGINVILIGGMTRMGSMAIEGLLGINILDKINIDTMFTSASGFTIEEGLTDFNVYEVELKKVMANKAEKIIALLDMSKIGTSSIATFAKCEQIDTLIVDDKLSDEYIATLANYNIKVD